MSYPSDYRYLPFSDTTNYVSKTEYHQIPATSPFEVRLNEVPEKASPSTMTIKVVTGWSGGSPVYGATMTEVSATPASGEYYPDYYTEADGDSNWNTGTIQFNSANANTTIEVTYMATGGLASIKSNHYPSWMTDRGDGSDGVFAPTSNTTIVGGVKNYTTVNIPVGVTVTFSSSVIIKCQGVFANGGTITVTPSGGAGGASPAGSDGWPGGDACGGGNGGTGGGDSSGSTTVALGGAGGRATLHYNDISRVAGGGGGGGAGADTAHSSYAHGAGGNGGGFFVCTTPIFNNNGSINVNGAAGGNGSGAGGCGGGGGGGGAAMIAANDITQGTINVLGGTGGRGSFSNGANGSAGTIFTKELTQ